MRLAVVSKYPPSVEGVTEYGRHIVNGLARRPEIDRLAVIANRGAAKEVEFESSVDVRRVWRVGEPALPFRILSEIRTMKPDVVWYNVSLSMFGETAVSMPGFALPAITKRLGIPSVVTLHEQRVGQISDLGVPDNALRRIALRIAVQLLLQSDVVCVTTADHRSILEKRRTPGRARIVHLPLCGYGEPSIESFPAQPTVLMLTSHAPHKNLPLLLAAFRMVRRRVPDARLIVAGIDHPRYPGDLAEMRSRYATETGVEWVGPVRETDLRSTFSQATLTVVPYRATTGSSATVHQAINVGRPVVSADLPELRAMAEEEDLWLDFFPPNNPEQLARALEIMLVDPVRRLSMAQHNLRSAQRNSLTAITERYLGLFQGQLGVSPSSTIISPYASGAPLR